MGTGLEIAFYALVAGATVYSVDQQEKGRSAANKAADRQKEAQQEQKAAQAQQAAQERRQQIREERVRRARILQAGENTGSESSSGEMGALGSLSTQLGANIGFNLGQISSAGRRSDLLQAGADFMTQSRGFLTNAQYGQQAASIFGTLGGAFGKTSSPPSSGSGQSLGIYPSPQSGP